MLHFFSVARIAHHDLEELRYEFVLGKLRRHRGTEVLKVREELHFFVDVFEGELAEEEADAHDFSVEISERGKLFSGEKLL